MKEWIKLHAPISVTTLNLRCFLLFACWVTISYRIVSTFHHSELPTTCFDTGFCFEFFCVRCSLLLMCTALCCIALHCTALTLLPPICVWRVIANLVMLFAPLRTNAIKWFSMFCLLFIFILLILTRWLYWHLVYNSILGCSRYSLLLQTTPYHGISGGNSITLNLFTFVSPRGV